MGQQQTPGLFVLLSRFLRLDIPLLTGLLLLCGLSLVVLYSASGQDVGAVQRQTVRFALAFGVMLVLAHVPPTALQRSSVFFYAIGMAMLVAVLLVGDVGKGAQRWLDLGFMRFQPSELMKVAVPMMVAWYVSQEPLPPRFGRLLVALGIVALPAALIMQQPDLGTALLVAGAGLAVVFMAGMQWRYILGALALAAVAAPLLWANMHSYQQQRVLTFLNPEADPLGAGYHIIQSKIAVGSGGLFGKGWLNGTQSHLDFLPERHTDFIFAVFGEEFGLFGAMALLGLYLFVIIRGLWLAADSQGTYGRLVSAAMVVTFLVYLFVNVGMVTGLLPVVGVPLPLVSYGGTSLVTLMIGFGIIMSAHSHRRLLS
ncbi:rod shape-determining protein RodA [Granulosicoccaceae sp. 1_MG-2023]|nr:rod shape-determining protein RodA [Granulosicoccaceae sp. 1_MG-2023]